jgi:choline dehydrogenase-like flavoprotein
MNITYKIILSIHYILMILDYDPYSSKKLQSKLLNQMMINEMTRGNHANFQTIEKTLDFPSYQKNFSNIMMILSSVKKGETINNSVNITVEDLLYTSKQIFEKLYPTFMKTGGASDFVNFTLLQLGDISNVYAFKGTPEPRILGDFYKSLKNLSGKEVQKPKRTDEDNEIIEKEKQHRIKREQDINNVTIEKNKRMDKERKISEQIGQNYLEVEQMKTKEKNLRTRLLEGYVDPYLRQHFENEDIEMSKIISLARQDEKKIKRNEQIENEKKLEKKLQEERDKQIDIDKKKKLEQDFLSIGQINPKLSNFDDDNAEKEEMLLVTKEINNREDQFGTVSKEELDRLENVISGENEKIISQVDNDWWSEQDQKMMKRKDKNLPRLLEGSDIPIPLNNSLDETPSSILDNKISNLEKIPPCEERTNAALELLINTDEAIKTKENTKRLNALISNNLPSEHKIEEKDAISLLLLHSQIITDFAQGYENDLSSDFLYLICEDLAKERIIAVLSGNFSCTVDEIEPIWNFLYKYDIDIKDDFRYFVIKKIYEELDYKLNISNMNTPIMVLIHNTCINADDKCIDCSHAAEKGHLECLKYAHENGCKWDNYTCSRSAEHGNLECLKYAHENGCEWDDDTCTYAARNGHLECLKYAHENGCKWNTDTCAYAAENGNLECLKYAHENGCEWNTDTCTYAAYDDHLECLKYAHENGCEWNDDTCAYAAEKGNLECLKYSHENGCEWDDYTCKNAAENGNLECLKYSHENGCEWDDYTCLFAAENGNLECLKYAHENGCKWNTDTCAYAARYGNLECLKYAHENGCKWNTDTCAYAAEKGNLECLKYAHENGCKWDDDTCTYAVRKGGLECLKYAHENGCKWNTDTCADAVRYGNLECLKYAHENGCEWNTDTCAYAAEKGNLECLKYAHENGCKWNTNTCLGATKAVASNLECLKYAHENGCEWDSDTCSFAAQNGNLECLKYAHENGCEWDNDTCSGAALYGHLECLKYAHENGCEWDDDTCKYAAQKRHIECLKYARENGCEESRKKYI